MGFYIELEKSSSLMEYRERVIPSVFWLLYGVLGFSLLCMGLAGMTVLKDLIREGAFWDQLLVAMIIAAIPIYLAIGIKLAGVRKFVRWDKDFLILGNRVFGREWVAKRIAKKEVAEILAVNHKPQPNLAARQHQDEQYYIKGHWRILVKNQQGKTWVVDKHTELEALHPLLEDLKTWRGKIV